MSVHIKNTVVEVVGKIKRFIHDDTISLPMSPSSSSGNNEMMKRRRCSVNANDTEFYLNAAKRNDRLKV